jgi:hypothetical protein
MSILWAMLLVGIILVGITMPVILVACFGRDARAGWRERRSRSRDPY